MSTAVFLHIGTMKSGTTFVQHALRQHREQLKRDGVLFPAAPGYRQQVAAVRDLLQMPGPVPAEELAGAWARLCEQVAGWAGHVVISVEHLSLARPAQIVAALAALSPAEVHAVVTARDLGRVLPSTWQENIQNGLTWSWPEFCASVTDEADATTAASDRFWRQHDVVALVDRWSQVIGAQRVHLVTVPTEEAPTDVLWRRFSQAVGIDADRYPVTRERIEGNASLDYAAAELLRRLNVALGDRLDRTTYAKHVKRSIAKEVLGRRVPRVPIRLEPDHLAWATARGESMVASLARSGVQVVGDLAELVATAPRPTATSTSSLDAEIVDAAVAASAAAIQELSQRLSRRQARPPGASRPQRKRSS